MAPFDSVRLSLADGRHIVKNFTNGQSVLPASSATCDEESVIRSKGSVRRGREGGSYGLSNLTPANPGRSSTAQFFTRASSRQVSALTVTALATIYETACLRRAGRGGVLEGAETALRRGLVDIELCWVMSDAGAGMVADYTRAENAERVGWVGAVS